MSASRSERVRKIPVDQRGRPNDGRDLRLRVTKAGKLIPLLIIAVGLVAYCNSFQGPFIFDDVRNILDNPTIHHVWPIWETLSPPGWSGVTGRPIINLTLAVNYAFGGTRVWGYHALNLVIHILAGLTLFGIVRRTLLQPRLRGLFGAAANGLALTTAVLWTVHPLQTESVTYIVQRCESIMGLFYLLTLYGFIRGAVSQRPRLWYGLCVTACALGMASKEVMVSAPLMVLLYDRTFVSGSFRVAWRRHGRLLWALAATWVLLGYALASGGVFGNASHNPLIRIGWGEYLLTEPGAIFHYLQLSVWPHPLCFDYYGPVATTWLRILPPSLGMAILLAATAWAWRANSVWGFISAWFFLILAPTSSFLPLDSPMYEHRMYLPLAAVVAAVVLGAFALGQRLLNKQQGVVLGCVAGGAVVVLFTFLTIQRNGDYNSELTIWQDTVEKCPNNPRAHNNLGFLLERMGRIQDADWHYREAVRIYPDYIDAQNNFGSFLSKLGKTKEAVTHFEAALRVNPRDAEAHNNWGNALLQLRRTQDAIKHYNQALEIKPDYPEAHYNLGNALTQDEKTEDAVRHYEEAIRIKPDYAEAHNNLGNLLLRLNKVNDAMRYLEQALRISPDFAEAHYNLGIALAQAGRTPEAIEHLQQALRIKPDFTEAQNALARLQPSQ
jgi:tetratricopeptide (TPR) repeat protein